MTYVSTFDSLNGSTYIYFFRPRRECAGCKIFNAEAYVPSEAEPFNAGNFVMKYFCPV